MPRLEKVLGLDEIARAREPEACRKLVTRAREHVREGCPRYGVSPERSAQIAHAFCVASRAGDISRLRRLLAEDVVGRVLGRRRQAQRRHQLINGRSRAERFYLGIARKHGFRAARFYRPVQIDGLPGFISDGIPRRPRWRSKMARSSPSKPFATPRSRSACSYTRSAQIEPLEPQNGLQLRGLEAGRCAAPCPSQAARGRAWSVDEHKVGARRAYGLEARRRRSCVDGTRGQLGIGIRKLLCQHDPSIFVKLRVRFAKPRCLLGIQPHARQFEWFLDLHCRSSEGARAL